MKFKGQGIINIRGLEYKKNIADSRRGGGGGSEHQKNPCIRAWRRIHDVYNVKNLQDRRTSGRELHLE